MIANITHEASKAWLTAGLVATAASSTGIVWAAIVCVSRSANRNSLYAVMNAKAAVATSPGNAHGTTTRSSVEKRVQPSSRAASSTSAGRYRKYTERKYTVKGNVNARYTRMSAR